MPTTKHATPALDEALKSFIGNAGSSTANVAKQAGVAVDSVQRILDRRFPKTHGAVLKWKQIRGYTEVVTRLCVFLQQTQTASLKPLDVLSQFKIPTSDQRVRGLISALQARALTERPAVSDPALNRILERKEVRASIILWPPFTESNADPKALLDSWACRYLNALLGTIDPRWRRSSPVGVRTIPDAIDRVVRTPDECDLLFGLYDTTFRRVRGIDFIPLPGIAAPLSARASTAMDWSDLVSGSRPVRAYAIKNEVGHVFMAGVAGYKDGLGADREVLTFESGDEAIMEFLRDIARNQTDPAARVRVLVADTYTTAVFKEAAAVWLESVALPDDDRSQLKGAWESTRSLDLGSFAPVYSVAIALRADASRLRRLLLTATRELFRTAPNFMAAIYADLLLKPGGIDSLEPTPLSPLLSAFEAHVFTCAFNELPAVVALTDTTTCKRLEHWRSTWCNHGFVTSDATITKSNK